MSAVRTKGLTRRPPSPPTEPFSHRQQAAGDDCEVFITLRAECRQPPEEKGPPLVAGNGWFATTSRAPSPHPHLFSLDAARCMGCGYVECNKPAMQAFFVFMYVKFACTLPVKRLRHTFSHLFFFLSLQLSVSDICNNAAKKTNTLVTLDMLFMKGA